MNLVFLKHCKKYKMNRFILKSEFMFNFSNFQGEVHFYFTDILIFHKNKSCFTF
jgi:hypothetical protein